MCNTTIANKLHHDRGKEKQQKIFIDIISSSYNILTEQRFAFIFSNGLSFCTVKNIKFSVSLKKAKNMKESSKLLLEVFNLNALTLGAKGWCKGDPNILPNPLRLE